MSISLNLVYLSLILGLTVSLLSDEIFGIVPGGMIVPGFVALIFEQWPRLILIYVVSLLTFLVVDRLLPKFIILYGRKKFVAFVITGLVLKLLAEFVTSSVHPEASLFLQGGTIIIPGLLASYYAKQGIRFTLPSSLAAAGLIYVVTQAAFMFM